MIERGNNIWIVCEVADLVLFVERICFYASPSDYDTVESGRDTSDSSISTMQIDGRNPKRATAPHPELD